MILKYIIMKILVTGAKGQLGIEIRKCFERGYTELGTPEILKYDNDVDYVDIDTLDISSLEAVRGVFEAKKYDAVINCAAYTNVNMAEGEGAEVAFKANAIGPRNLAIVCEENGAKLIHVSTDYVFAELSFLASNISESNAHGILSCAHRGSMATMAKTL